MTIQICMMVDDIETRRRWRRREEKPMNWAGFNQNNARGSNPAKMRKMREGLEPLFRWKMLDRGNLCIKV